MCVHTSPQKVQNSTTLSRDCTTQARLPWQQRPGFTVNDIEDSIGINSPDVLTVHRWAGDGLPGAAGFDSTQQLAQHWRGIPISGANSFASWFPALIRIPTGKHVRGARRAAHLTHATRNWLMWSESHGGGWGGDSCAQETRTSSFGEEDYPKTPFKATLEVTRANVYRWRGHICPADAPCPPTCQQSRLRP